MHAVFGRPGEQRAQPAEDKHLRGKHRADKGREQQVGGDGRDETGTRTASHC